MNNNLVQEEAYVAEVSEAIRKSLEEHTCWVSTRKMFKEVNMSALEESIARMYRE